MRYAYKKMALGGSVAGGPPDQGPSGECMNPDCKSYGSSHPNCKCEPIGEEAMAAGGELMMAGGGGVPDDDEDTSDDQDTTSAPSDDSNTGSDDQTPASDDSSDNGQSSWNPDYTPDADQPTPASAPQTQDTQSGLPAQDDAKLSPGDRMKMMRDYLQAKYAEAADPSTVQAARKEEQHQLDKAGMFQGLRQMLGAEGVAVGMKDTSQQQYAQDAARAHMSVAQAEADRQNKIKDFMTGQQLGRQSDEDIKKDTVWQEAQQNNQVGSDKAKSLWGQYTQMFPDMNLDPDAWKGLTVNDIKDNYTKPIQIAQIAQSKQAQIEATKQQHADALEQRKSEDATRAANFQANLQFHKDSVAQTNAIRQSQIEDRASKDDKAADSKFETAANKINNTYQDASGKIKNAKDAIDQGTKGMLPGQIVPMEVAKGLMNQRLAVQEIGMVSGDQSWKGQLDRFWEGKTANTLTAQDAKEYSMLLDNQQKQLDATNNAKLGGMADYHDSARGYEPGSTAKKFKINQPQSQGQGGQGSQGAQNQAPAQDPQISKYATDNNLSYGQAQTILTKRGYGK